MAEFRLIQNGATVVRVSCADRSFALREARHYAMVYASDGPEVRVEEKVNGKWRELDDGDTHS